MGEKSYQHLTASGKTHLTYIGGRPKKLRLRRCRLRALDLPDLEGAFDAESICVGSLESNDLTISDPSVSRRHCKILQEDEGYLVIDSDSTNGTFVDGVRVREAYIMPGASLRVGNIELRFEAGEEEVDVEPAREESLGDLVGADVKMRELFSIIRKIASTRTTVVIQGETGVGKDVVARTIHELSPRRTGPFVVFDCGAVPPNLIESELFGHEKGSFTGAITMRRGLAETAHGGTLFLDEVGELSAELQPKLLRFLERREIRRVGGVSPIKVDVRVLAATNRNLEEEVCAGRFREDLYYRLSVLRLDVPPLRDRSGDIPRLVKHFLTKGAFNRGDDGKLRVKGVTQEAMDLLRRFSWPGNVRQLLNVVERGCSFSNNRMITPEELPEYINRCPEAPQKGRPVIKELPYKKAKQRFLDGFEKEYIAGLLEENEWNVSKAAREAEIDRKYFRKLMNKHGLKRPSD